MPRRAHLAVLVETSTGYGRAIIAGIARYAHAHAPEWTFDLRPGDVPRRVPDLGRGKIDGVLARIPHEALADAIARTDRPAVSLTEGVGRFPLVETDWAAVARLAAEHLREKGLCRLAFCGWPGARFSNRREHAFQQAARSLHLPCETFPEPPSRRGRTRPDAHRRRRALRRWLQSLDKPVGLLAANDDLARLLLDLASELELDVPDQLAVLGIHNDEPFCLMARPALTSVDTDGRRVGYEAAARLHRMLRRPSRRVADLAVPPRGVIERRSTERAAADDSAVLHALRYIDQRLDDARLDVSALADHVGLSRRALELRFRRELDRTPGQAIIRARLRRAQRLLIETDLPLGRIADASGFASPAHFSRAFHRETGQTPSALRCDHRPGG